MLLEDGCEVLLREAVEDDMDGIKKLYYLVYGGKYTLAEINNTDKMRWAINDPNYLWLLDVYRGEIIGSVLFVVDPEDNIGKAMAGVVHPEFRGSKLMARSMRRGMTYLMEQECLCDLIYAVVRTFISTSFHRELQDLGFVDLGVFPNVRKVREYETHGLKVHFLPGIFEARRKKPQLTRESNEVYKIVRKKLKLESASVKSLELAHQASEKKLELYIERSSEVEWEYYRKRDQKSLSCSFFPFHYPQARLYSKDRGTEAFLHFQEWDGHAALLGFKTDNEDVTAVLGTICNYAESMGAKYLELLISAYERRMQQMAYDAGFLPTAYFPAAQKTPEGERLDYVVTSRTFVPPNFKGVKLTEESKPYIQTYYKLYTKKLWEDIQSA
jgi:hypothetical protein